MKKFINLSLIVFWIFGFMCFALQGFANTDSTWIEKPIILKTPTGELYGTLSLPKLEGKCPVALIIAGSGPTDRDGNNPMMKNNSLKMLGDTLAAHGIASVRFDKRGIAESKNAGKNEIELRFDDYVDDAKAWIQLLKNDGQFSKVILIGHSEGSMIGILSAENSDGLISIAGVAHSIDEILKTQLKDQPESVKNIAFPMLDSLKAGKLISKVNPLLYNLFRPSVQPYMISWMKFTPKNDIQKLKIPILILQGDKDLQVSVQEAELLAKAQPKATLKIIPKMNHIFKIIEGDKNENIQSYSNPKLPISSEMVSAIVDFIHKM